MVDVMVEEFREIQLRIAEKLEQHETPEFKALDGRIASVFNAIYRHVPRNAEETRTMVGFFLDIIENNDTGDNVHLIARVRTLTVPPTAPRPPDMEITGGAGI
ncbi:hypothetical protein BSY16_305 [Sinorhizobium sp. RAC02]|nr:hypothetical protein BSY16_305 [Sinorhizobium sp. RAC02]